MNAFTEEELIKRTLSGDDAAFTELIKQHQNLIATTSINMLGDHHDAEEAGQETFIRLYKSLHKFNGESKLSTYVNRICINVCLTKLKKRQSWLKRFTRVEEKHSRKPLEESFENFDERELLRKAMKHLDTKHRAVIMLRMIEGYNTAETAVLLDIPEGTVLSRLKRGMDRLKQILIEKFNYEH